MSTFSEKIHLLAFQLSKKTSFLRDFAHYCKFRGILLKRMIEKAAFEGVLDKEETMLSF